jgi:hypothetical protein
MTLQVNSLELKIASYLSERYVQELRGSAGGSEPHGGVMLQREILVGKKAEEKEQKKKKKKGKEIGLWSTLVPFEKFRITKPPAFKK